MILRGPQVRFEINIASGPDHDGWCKIQIILVTPTGRWSRIDPCLMNHEVGHLANWLEETARGEVEGRLEFIEPELAFSRNAAGGGQVQVELLLKFRPTWAGGDSSEPYCVEIPAESGQLKKAAEQLRFQASSLSP